MDVRKRYMSRALIGICLLFVGCAATRAPDPIASPLPEKNRDASGSTSIGDSHVLDRSLSANSSPAGNSAEVGGSIPIPDSKPSNSADPVRRGAAEELAVYFDQESDSQVSLTEMLVQPGEPNPLAGELKDAESIPFPRQGIPVPPGDLPLPLTESPEQQSVRRPKSSTDLPSPEPENFVRLDDVIGSVYVSFPLLASAIQQRDIAAGQQLSAAGAYDLKLKASSEAGQLGFYQTYRQSVGMAQPTYNGGEVFAGYRIGRGDFQPWYQERQTNDGGEFRVGASVPLLKNRNIDPRRAELWRSTYERQIVEPEIQAQLIDFVLEASYAYWNWVAAGQYYLVDARVLKIAEDRTTRIKRQVEVGLIDPPQLTDNYRLIAVRKAAVAESARKFRESGVKLSLFYRNTTGDPVIPSPDVLPNFPDPQLIEVDLLQADIDLALAQRPELKTYDLLRRKLDVDLAEAKNEFRPSLDAVIAGSQDVGAPTSSKRDKSPFELETGIFADVAVQRRKARGKTQMIEAKLAQVTAKRRMTEDKIVADVQASYAALVATYEAVKQTIIAVQLAEELAERERRNFESGLSDLLTVALREQFAAESAFRQVEALKQYYHAKADYRAALAQDQAPLDE